MMKLQIAWDRLSPLERAQLLHFRPDLQADCDKAVGIANRFPLRLPTYNPHYGDWCPYNRSHFCQTEDGCKDCWVAKKGEH